MSGTLFDTTPPPRGPLAVATSRSTDPRTSRTAARVMNRSGRAAAQAATVLDLLGRMPGSTSAEIAAAGKLDRYVPSRRCPDLEKKGLVKRGPDRICKVNGTRACTWTKIPQ